MGFRGDAQRQRRKTAPKKASGLQMILILIAMAASVFLGYWAPTHLPFRGYLPIPNSWYAPIVRGAPVYPMQIIVGVVAFILMQFVIVLISGLLFPLAPEETYDKDGLYRGKRQK